MNIFYLHQDPHEAAKLQYNKHVVKMILESAQMLCTAHHCIMGELFYGGFEQPPQCMPDEYKDECSIQAYWNYYIGDKKHIANLKTESLYEKRPKATYQAI